MFWVAGFGILYDVRITNSTSRAGIQYHAVKNLAGALGGTRVPHRHAGFSGLLLSAFGLGRLAIGGGGNAALLIYEHRSYRAKISPS
jgi:hypothetical protein